MSQSKELHDKYDEKTEVDEKNEILRQELLNLHAPYVLNDELAEKVHTLWMDVSFYMKIYIYSYYFDSEYKLLIAILRLNSNVLHSQQLKRHCGYVQDIKYMIMWDIFWIKFMKSVDQIMYQILMISFELEHDPLGFKWRK